MEAERPKDRLGAKVIKIGICQPGSGTGRPRRRRRWVVGWLGGRLWRGEGRRLEGFQGLTSKENTQADCFPHKPQKNGGV